MVRHSLKERSNVDLMKNYSFSLKLFISFSLLLLVITIAYVIAYDNAVINSSKKEIGKNCIGKLKVAENTILEFKNTIRKDTIRLSVNSAINILSEIKFSEDNGRRVIDTNDLIKLSDALEVILEAVNTNTRYESIYLCIDDLGYSLTSNQGFVPITDLNDTGWLKYYNDYKSKGMSLGWIDTRLPYGGNEYEDYLAASSIITYIYPLTPYTTALRGALVVNVREDVLSKLINTDNINREGYIYIINSNGNVISHVDKNFLCKDISGTEYINSIINSGKDEGYIITEVDNKSSIVSYYKSPHDGWIYMGVFSLEALKDSLDNIRANIIYLSILITIMSVVLAYAITRKLCSPVKKLIQDIKLDKGINILDAGDEMAILRKAFESISNELEKNKMSMIQNYLSSLLKGKFMYETDNFAHIEFHNECFICVAMSIDKYDEFTEKYKVIWQYYLKMIVISIAEQVFSSICKCTGVNMDNGEIALILNLDDIPTDETKKEIMECFYRIQKETSKIFDNTISIGIGRCYKDIFEISTSYMEATQALKLKLIYGYGSVIFWNEDLEKHKYYFPVTIEKYLMNQVKTGNISAVEKTVKQLVEELKSKIGLSSDNVRQIFNQLVGDTVIKYLTDSNVDMSHIFGSNFNIYNELSKKETLEDIEQWLINIYKKMFDYLGKYKSDDDKISKIMGYIQMNYKKDIGIQDIADYVGLSYSHVRKVFKDKIGKNIGDVINSLRMNEAKDLLVRTEISIKDLALLLGYNSDQTFSRVFKKFEGITPGEYRTKTALIDKNTTVFS